MNEFNLIFLTVLGSMSLWFFIFFLNIKSIIKDALKEAMEEIMKNS